MDSDLKIPHNFAATANSYNESQSRPRMDYVRMPQPVLNPHTINFCSILGLDDPLALLVGAKKSIMTSPKITPPRQSVNTSELNITLESSKLSSTTIDEVSTFSSFMAEIVIVLICYTY